MGSILTGQAGFQSALGQQVPGQTTQQSGSVNPMSNGQVLPYSAISGQNPFIQAGADTSSQFNTGFNGGTGSYNFANPNMPNFSTNQSGQGQMLSTGQMQNGQNTAGGLGAQTQGNTQMAGAGGGAYSGNPFMQQLMQMFSQLPQYQNLQGTSNPAAQVPQQPTQHVGPQQSPTIAAPGGASGWTAGSGLNQGLQNQAVNTTTGSNRQGEYQEVYNPKTQEYAFSNPWLKDFGGWNKSTTGAEQQFNTKYGSDAITNPTGNLNYGNS